MTAIGFQPRQSARAGRAKEVVLALMLGAAIGASTTFILFSQSRTGALAAAPESGVVAARMATGATTTAGQQYVGWYTRSSVARPATTTAGQQYLDWYTRSSDAWRWDAASRQYASWYMRNAAGQ